MPCKPRWKLQLFRIMCSCSIFLDRVVICGDSLDLGRLAAGEVDAVGGEAGI